MPKKKFSTENDVSNFRSKSQKSRCPNPRRTHVTNRTKPKHFPIGSDATAPTFRHVSLKFYRVETKARTERFERKLVFQKCIVLQEVVCYVDLMCSEPTLSHSTILRWSPQDQEVLGLIPATSQFISREPAVLICERTAGSGIFFISKN